jgi:hypothetical protein
MFANARSFPSRALPALALLVSATLGFAAVPAASAAANSPKAGAKLAQDYGKLPLSFEANQGQTDPQVKFLTRGSGYSLFLTDRAAVLSLSKGKGGQRDAALDADGKADVKTDVVRMELAGASGTLQVSGQEQLPGKANYFVGNDPAKWHSNVPTFAKVRYSAVYPGVDLVYYGNQGQLEYDFVVAPGASTAPIQLHFAGAERLKLTPNGDLEVIANNSQVAFRRPVAYQDIDGRRQPVEGRFTVLANNKVGFVVGQYDQRHELVIDPTLVYSTYLGGSLGSAGTGIAVDSTGSAYVTGETADADFPVTTGTLQTTHKARAGVTNAFLSKFSADGTHLLFSTYLGGSGNSQGGGDAGMAIAVDSSGNSYVTGYTYSSDFPLKNAYQSTNKAAVNELSEPFVAKINPTGTALVYSTYLGGSSNIYSVDRGDLGLGIAVNAAGNAYIAGNTYSTDFPVSSGAFQTVNKSANSGAGVGFVAALNPAGTALVYSTYLGGSGVLEQSSGTLLYYHGDGARGIAVDAAGNAYVSGQATSTDFPVTSGVLQPTNHGAAKKASNGFVAKLNPTGTGLIYSTFLGGSSAVTNASCFHCKNGDGIAAIAIDTKGDAFVTGGTYSADFPITSNAYQKVNHGVATGTYTAFASEINPAGTQLVYSTFLGGSGALGEVAYGLSLDASGDVYLGGFTASSDFPVTANAYQTVNLAAKDGTTSTFLTELNPSGSGLVYSTFLGGSGYPVKSGSTIVGYTGDTAYSLALDSAGNAYMTGSATSPNFPVSAGAFQTKAAAQTNVFVAKFALAPTTVPTATTTTVVSDGNPEPVGVKVTFTADVTGTGKPTGTVGFSIDGAAAVVVALDDTGHAAYPTTALKAGVHSIKASYSGDANNLSSSATLSETIYGPAASITSVSGTPQSAPYGSAFTAPLLVVVKDAGGNVVPGALVTFKGSTGLKLSAGTETTAANGETSITASAIAAGTFTVSASVAGVSQPATFALTGSKVALTVAALKATVAYGQPIPKLTYTISGFVNGDTSSVVSGTPTETTTATQGSNYGNYPITIACTPLSSANYSFTCVNATLTITALGQAATPAFSVKAGTYTAAQTVSLTDSTTGAVIYYTTNGSTPSASSTQYTAAIHVAATETIKAVAIAKGYTPSAYGVAAYVIETPAATPVIAPAGGTYAAAQSVTIKDATNGATIYYTTNNTTPTTASTKYTGAITVSSTTTIRALAAATGSLNSAVAVATFTITKAAATPAAKHGPIPTATPTLSPAGGTYSVAQTVTMRDTTSGAAIYYTTNGSTPTTSSTRYVGAIKVAASTTIKAIAVAPNYTQSAVAVATFTITNAAVTPEARSRGGKQGTAATPSFSLIGGTYSSAKSVTISDLDAIAAIYYTTNGTTPTTSSARYTGPITVSKTMTIKAVAFVPTFLESAVASVTYTIN